MSSAWLQSPIAWDATALQAFGGGTSVTSAPARPSTVPTPSRAPTLPPSSRAPARPSSRAPARPGTSSSSPPPSRAPTLPPALRLPNVVTIVHAESWMSLGALKVLSIRGTGPTVEEYTSRDLAQVFAVEGREGQLRNVAGQGQTLQVESMCSNGTLGGRQGGWSFKRVGAHPLQYELAMECMEGPKKLSGDLSLVPIAQADPGASWFVVPVGALSK